MPGERRSLVDEGVVQLARTDTGSQAERDAKRLAPRAAGTQPAGGGPPDAPLELGLPGVECVAERRVPRKLVAGYRVQLEEPAQERPRVAAARSPPSTSATACARSASESPRASRGPWALSAA